VYGPDAILPLLGEAYCEQGIEEGFLIHPLVHELQNASLCRFQLMSGPRRITYQEPPIPLQYNVQPGGAGGDEGDDYRIRESWLTLPRVSPHPTLSLGARLRGLRRAFRARNRLGCAGPLQASCKDSRRLS
jgi:hypothetical protein